MPVTVQVLGDDIKKDLQAKYELFPALPYVILYMAGTKMRVLGRDISFSQKGNTSLGPVSGAAREASYLFSVRALENSVSAKFHGPRVMNIWQNITEKKQKDIMSKAVQAWESSGILDQTIAWALENFDEVQKFKLIYGLNRRGNTNYSKVKGITR